MKYLLGYGVNDMKKFLFSTGIVFILTLVVSTVAFAALPGTGWWSAYQVQNVGGSDGSVTMSAYDASSSSVYGSDSFVFGHGDALAYDPGVSPNYGSGGNYIGFSSSLPSGFEGSLVLSASVPVLSVAQVANYANGSVGLAGGAATGEYQGFSTALASTDLRFPIVKSNWANAATSFYIQATDSAGANVTFTFNMNDGSVFTQTQYIEANKMYMFDPATAGAPTSGCGTDFNLSPCFGAGVASSDTPIAGVVIEHPYSGSPVGAILVTRGLTSSDASSTLFVPSIKYDYYNAVAGASIMNVGTEDARVQITLTVTLGPNAGEIYTDELIIQPNSTQTFSKWLNNLGGMPSGNFAAAKIESLDDVTYDPQPLVGISNDTKAQALTPMGYGRTAAYAFAVDQATATNGAPVVKEYHGSFTGGLTVVNVGDASTTIYFEYHEYGTDNVYTFWTASAVEANAAVNTGRISYNPSGTFVNGGGWDFSELRYKEFSVLISTSNDEPIVTLVTAYDPSSSKFYDIMNYEGFGYTP